MPEVSAQWMTGNETPSSCRNTTPSTSGSSMTPGLIRARLATKDSSVPALKIQASNVPNAAVIQATATAVQNESK